MSPELAFDIFIILGIGFGTALVLIAAGIEQRKSDDGSNETNWE